MKTQEQPLSSYQDEHYDDKLIYKDEIIDKIENWMEENNYSQSLRKFTDLDQDRLKEFGSNLWDGHMVGIDFKNLVGINDRPDWLDLNKLKSGQDFARDFYVSVCSSEITCLLFIISNDNVLRKLIWTGKSSDAYTSFKRYLSTGKRVRTWMITDLFDSKSDGFKNIEMVNRIHGSFYSSLEKSEESEFLKRTELSDTKPVICPFLLKDVGNLNSPVDDVNHLPEDKLPMTQTEMTVTLFSFVGFLILEPEKFGICPIKYAEGLEGFVHLWRYLGYRLGTLDEYNLCSGSYEEVKAKSQILVDFLLKPNLKRVNARWEHMTRSIIDGLNFYTDGFSYETHLMFGMDMLNIPYTQLYTNSSFVSKLQLHTMQFMHSYLIPMSWFRTLFTNMLLGKIDKVSAKMPTKEEFKKKVK